MENNNLIRPFEIVGEEVNLDPSKGMINPIAFTEDSPHINKKKSFEDKHYLLLYVYATDDGYEEKSFEFIVGRTNLYNFIKDMAGSMNMHESLVIVETVTLEEALKEEITAYKFVKHVKQYMPEDGFDPDDYVKGDSDEDTVSVDTESEAYGLWRSVNTNGAWSPVINGTEEEYKSPESSDNENKFEPDADGEYNV